MTYITLHRVACTGSLLLFACIASGSVTDQDGRSIVEHALRAQGLMNGHGQIRTLQADGQYEGLDGFQGTFHRWATAPNRQRIDWDIRYLQDSRVYDGRNAWLREPVPRELVGSDKLHEERSALLFPLLAYWRMHLPMQRVKSEDSSKDIEIDVDTATGKERFTFDRQTGLPTMERRAEPYDEGMSTVELHYADYRSVGSYTLPFSITESRPPLTARYAVRRYLINAPIGDSIYASKAEGHLTEPYELSLKTVPAHLYLEEDGIEEDDWQRFWGIPFAPTESVTADFVINERLGRFVAPSSGRMEFLSQGLVVKTEIWTGEALKSLSRFPATRFSPLAEIFHFRQSFTFEKPLNIDACNFTFEGVTPTGQKLSQSLQIPISHYELHHSYIFPIAGKFIITTGHEYYELAHKYERSQAFAMDIVPLGPNFEYANNEGVHASDYYAFDRVEVIAPASGTVVFARNDVPDEEVKSEFLKGPDGLTAIAGNVVIIDHGEGEFSVFAHLHRGSVVVKAGDHLVQGQTIGRIGASGSPDLPHLHYQLQNSPLIFGGDGLPVRFSNVFATTWVSAGKSFAHLKRGVFYVAR